MTEAEERRWREIVQVGDWVRFYHAGQLVLSEVVYLQKQNTYPFDLQACTLVAPVEVTRILEVRRQVTHQLP